MEKSRTTIIIGILIVVLLLLTASIIVEHRRTTETGYLSASQLEALNATTSNISVLPDSNEIFINSSATILVMLGPMNSPSMYSFEIFGLYNPHLIIRVGSLVRFYAVNVDTDSYHNFVITDMAPPYGYTIMGNMGEMGSMMPYLPPQSEGHFAYYVYDFSFAQTGTLWYICTYPGHAEHGMYGEITVSSA
ncbi:rusticyanin [Thermoplasma sp. Kam2015]|uniref:rusticyanin n=1 Tax=Thermoplasma sp. Kam2015 TaxID=2094122 RepID=UPI000D9F3302|nr:rusticyanin [Thermoplasma sp. Kam2015]PYB68045.1 rusticyanin [Thermoplasma sp. Kam2015]